MQTTPFDLKDFNAVSQQKQAGKAAFVPYVKGEKAPEAHRYTPQDLIECERKGFDAGYTKGFEEGVIHAKSQETAINQELTLTLKTVDQKITSLASSIQQAQLAALADTTLLAQAIAETIAGHALQQNPTAAIEHLVAQCMEVLFSSTEITFHLHPDMLEPARRKISELAEQRHLKATIHYTPDASISKFDCAINWQNGGTRLSSSEGVSKVRAILAQYKLGSPELPQPQDIPQASLAKPPTNMDTPAEPIT